MKNAKNTPTANTPATPPRAVGPKATLAQHRQQIAVPPPEIMKPAAVPVGQAIAFARSQLQLPPLFANFTFVMVRGELG